MSLRSTQRRFLIGLIALLAGCTLSSAPESQPVSGEPVVQIVSPQPNAIYLEGVAVNIQATVSNAGTDIDRVEIVVDGSTVATIPSPNADGATMFNATYGWSAAGVGTHTLGVTAYRTDGTSSAPATVEINVIEANGTPGAGSTNSSGTAPSTSSSTTGATPTTGTANLQPSGQATAAAVSAADLAARDQRAAGDRYADQPDRQLHTGDQRPARSRSRIRPADRRLCRRTNDRNLGA